MCEARGRPRVEPAPSFPLPAQRFRAVPVDPCATVLNTTGKTKLLIETGAPPRTGGTHNTRVAAR
eukprot:SAG11_NODE_5015_length_1691_cov_0.947236_3_plen_64_part_01